MRYPIVAAALAAAALAGCANLGTLERTTALPDGGTAIHLDAPQRLVYTSKDGKLCAEASPDALQAFAHSVGGGLTLPNSGVAASVAAALATPAGSIGLRTQSITLVREGLYRICEANHNGLTPDVVQLIERSQDLTLGVLAIEQLTGAVAARQVVLTGDTNSQASANIGSTQKQLADAKAQEATAKAALDSAQADQKAAQDAVDAATKDLDTKTKDLATAPNDAGRKQAVAQAQAALDAANADLKTKSDAADTAKSDNDRDHDATETIKQNLDSAIAIAKAAAKSAGQLSDGTNGSTIDKDTAAAVADATTSIVRMVLDKGHMTDACMSLISDYANKPEKYQAVTFDRIYKQCEDVVMTSLEAYKQSVKAANDLAKAAAEVSPAAAAALVAHAAAAASASISRPAAAALRPMTQ